MLPRLKRFNRSGRPGRGGAAEAMRQRVTIRDVARRAGVAVGTVSHHLNRSAPVSDATTRRIQRAIDALGFRVDLGARGLRARRTHSVGLVVPDISNPFYAEVARAIEHALWEEGFQTLLCDSAQDPERERGHLAALEQRRVDGVLLIRTGEGRPARAGADAAGVPTVYLDRAVAGRPSVSTDNRLGGALAARHLAELGHVRVGILAGESRVGNVRHRLRGFTEELGRHGVTVREDHVVRGPQAIALGHEVARLFERAPAPTAVFATNDVVAIGAWRTLLELGLRIPEDVSLVGFDDIEMSGLLLPPLTTVRQDKAALGREAARLLLALVAGEPPAGQGAITIPPELVRRGSTAAPRQVPRRGAAT
jgi:LacI family transcriptional regulator